MIDRILSDLVAEEPTKDEEITRREAARLQMVRQVAKAIMKDGNAYAGAHSAGLIYPFCSGKNRRHTIDLMALGDFIQEGQAAGVLPVNGHVGEMPVQVIKQLRKWRQ